MYSEKGGGSDMRNAVSNGLSFAMAAPETFARVVSLSVQDVFSSSEDNQLKASVEVENGSDFTHSTQIVFRGYVRQADQLLYEFLHEQVWIIVQPNGTAREDVAVDVWLPRFPPTMRIGENIFVEYAVRATVDPWFENTHIEKPFKVHRTLVLKMPHNACYPKKVAVNECVGHGGWSHKQCKPINGELLTDKGGYSHGEVIRVRWRLRHEQKLEKVQVLLEQIMEYRLPDPGHHMTTREIRSAVAEKEMQVTDEDKDNYCELKVPSGTCISMPMTLWNVLSVNYRLVIKVKSTAHKEPVDLLFPVIISNEPVQGVARKKGAIDNGKTFERAIDRDDDSDDDDDFDSDIDGEETRGEREFSVDLERIEIKTEKEDSLGDAYAQVFFVMNSDRPRPLTSLRLLFQGEARAHSCWYEFIRFKAIVSTDATSTFSPGPHSVKISLPFRDSQYDTNILPPSLGDDIRYICRASMESWRKNVIPIEKDIFVDRYVDTWAKEEYKTAHSEQIGAYGISMRQRMFQRGKHAFAKVSGSPRKVQLELVQMKRMRVPGLLKEDSYCHERTVAVKPCPDDRALWPEEWSIRVPLGIPPSIEISYWNVLVLTYALVVVVTLDDGHQHRHIVPIWIGCSDDKLEEPKAPVKMEELLRARDPDLGELPEFEVIRPEETHIQPYWVERYNNHTYYYDV